MQKNVAGQKYMVFAFGGAGHASEGEPITGDAANITANLRLDGGAANAVDDVNPTETEDGYYIFDLTQAESNANLVHISPQSSTANVEVIGVPGALYTTPASFNAATIALASAIATAQTDLDTITGTDGVTLATAQALYAPALASVATEARLAELDAANMPADIDAIPTTPMRGTDSAATAAALATAQLDLDTITDTDGVVLGAAGVDLIADEPLTGATHNVVSSLGRRIRELEDATLIRGEAFQAGSTITSVVLDAGASAIDDFYNFTILRIVDGVGADQERIITDYDGTTKAATITPALTTAAPVSGDEFKIVSGGSVHAETQGGGYEGGAIWIDTVGGSAGTLLYVNGTVDNAVNNIADARTLADALGIQLFHSLPGTSFALGQTFNSFEFIGAGYTVALDGRDIGGSRFFNCAVSGTGTGSIRAVFRECIFVGAPAILATASLLTCNLAANIAFTSAGTYRLTNCVHGATVIFELDFGLAVGDTVVHLHDYHGAVKIKNMGQTGTDTLHFDSAGGKLILDSTNIGGTVNYSGTFDFDNTSSGMTLNEIGAINERVGAPVGASISADIVTAQTDLDTIAGTDGVTLATAQANYAPAIPSEVLTQVNAALDTAIAEIAQGVPTATPTLRTCGMLLYMALRNRLDVDTSGTDELQIYNNAGVVITKKLLTDDDIIYSEAEMVSGP